MNAIDTIAERTRAPLSARHLTRKFRLLLRREFWEHKGGFLWTPVIAGGVFLALVLAQLGFDAFSTSLRLVSDASVDIKFNVLDLDVRGLASVGPGDLRNFGHDVVDPTLYAASTLPFIPLGIVVFFYCLGALYDERKDRGVLFWKSLPLSDQETVLAKVASAVLVAPGLATAIAIGTMFAFLGLVSALILVKGGNPMRLLWEPGSPLVVAGTLVASIPVYAVWALPTVGWLLLCSAWAKTKPFLWAIMIPVLAGVFVSWFDLMTRFNLESAWFWKNVVSRMLLSVVPRAWLPFTDGLLQGFQLWPGATLRDTYRLFTTPQPWVGAVAGAVMIYGAIRLRRWREDG